MQSTVNLAWKPVTFGGAKMPSDPQRQEQMRQRLADYRSGLLKLVVWDHVAHSVPVFQQINVPALLASAKKFLDRQWSQTPSDTTPFMIMMSGKSASGKTTIKKNWLAHFQKEAGRRIGWRVKQDGPIISDIDMDNYYKDHAAQRKAMGDERFFKETNLDWPGALTIPQVVKDVFALRNGKVRRTPKISYADSTRREGAQFKTPSPFFVVEGLFALQPPQLRKQADLKVFVDLDAGTQHKRWWGRAPERNIRNDEAGNALFKRTMEMQGLHVEPYKKFADIIINGASSMQDSAEAMKRLTRLLLQTFSPKNIPHP